MTNKYNYTGHWKQSEFQGGTGGSQKEGMMQRHVVSWREASVDSPAHRWRRGCFCSHFLVVGQGLGSLETGGWLSGERCHMPWAF